MNDEETSGPPVPEEGPVRRRRVVLRRGGHSPTGPTAANMSGLPASVTVSDPPTVPAPQAPDDADDEGSAT
ncbi:hypothetical protein [Streptomyces sp. H39-C1]|uniref:hypothetical protein n=1 Tax=Streptomyces sp. H39-C1 TaxID=3004355 RepID=UPI0022AF167F|nr:hypothetical protein [Streptomyces sp. H39-C1]MCZ4096922.1 hypothetical protein [Streptomyces sp. H39-C1]